MAMKKIVMTAPNLKKRAEAIIEELETKDVEVFDLELIGYIAKNYPQTAFIRHDKRDEGCEYFSNYTAESVIRSLEMDLDIRASEKGIN